MKKSKKPKYKLGAFLKENTQPISQATGLAGQLINAGSNPTDEGAGIASGALSGASAGMAFGPIGAGVGALVGGVSGAFGAQQAQAAKKELDQKRQNLINTTLLNNAGNSFAKGGVVTSRLGKAVGGILQPISEDAVEVKANNPSQTDSVELKDAYVDHGEVIDRKNRVFSDELGYAKLAKKLEKQKSPSTRFSASNERIEQKLDNLFQEQESMKKNTAKGKYKMLNGGELDPTKPPVGRITNQPYKDPVEYTRDQYTKGLIPSNEEYALSYFNRNPKANRVISGTSINNGAEFPNQVIDAFEDTQLKSKGLNPVAETALYDSAGQLPVSMKPGKDKGGFIKSIKDYKAPELKTSGKIATKLSPTNQTFPNTKSSKLDLEKGVTGLATFTPNIVSTIAQRNLKGPAAPQLEATTRLERMSANDMLANADRQGLAADKVIKNNTAQGSDIAAGTGNILAKKLAAKNQIYGDTQRTNAQIQAQEAGLNTQIKARNTERVNQFNNDINDFSNLQQKLTTENASNLSSKILSQIAERNRIKLDKEKSYYNSLKFKDSGVYDRTKAQAEIDNPEGFKKGGTIHIKPENKGKFNALKKRTGKTTEELKHSKNPLTRKRATFAANAKKWNHKK